MADPTLGHRRGDSGGFALAVAILALVLVAAVVAGGYFTALQEIRIGQGMKSVTRSFYAGESGIQRTLAGWDPAVFNALEPGDSLVLGPYALEDGSSYRLRAFRVDDDSDPQMRYFYIEAAGRGPGHSLGERRQAVLARVRYFSFCCGAALTVTDSLVVGSNSKVYGLNADPLNWMNAGACADYPTDHAPGILAPEPAPVDDRLGDVTGDPAPILTDAALDSSNLLVFDALSYDDMAALADVRLPPGSDVSSIGPVEAGGECDRTASLNWGSPENASHPCFDYFPIIHATGDLHLQSGAGQGILLVDGDLDVDGQFAFYGIVLVQGRLYLRARATIRGGVMVKGNSPDVSMTEAPNARIELSRCAIERAQRLSKLARGELLPRRAWMDLF